MKLKHFDPNTKNVLVIDLIPMDLFLLENCENWVKKNSTLCFSIRLSNFLQNKTLCNSLINTPNEMNIKSLCSYKFILWGKTIVKFFQQGLECWIDVHWDAMVWGFVMHMHALQEIS